MNQRKSSTRESFDSVHRFLWSASLSEPPERLHPEIRRFLDTFHSLVQQDVDGVASQAAASRLAVVLFSMLKNTESEELRDMLAPELPTFGPFGLALAAHYIVASPFETKEWDKLFSDLPPHLLLALMDEVVVRAGGREEIRDWAIAFLDVLASQNEEAATQHLAFIQNDLERPSYALERAILDGPFGKRLHQVMESPKSMWEVAEYAQNAAILPSAPLAEPLAGHLDSCPAELLPPIIEVLAKLGKATPALTKAVANRLSHKDEKVRVAALDGLLVLRPPNIGPLLAKVHARLLGLRDVLITRLPLLPRADFNAFLKQIPDEQRPDLLYRLYCLLSRLDPESLKSTLRQTLVELGRKRPAQSTVQSLEAWFPEPELPLPDRPEPPTPTESMTLAGNAPKDSGGLLGGLFGKPGKKSAGKASQQEQVLRVVKNKLQRAEFKAHRLPGALLEDAELDGCVMERAYFEKAVFTRCAIRHVNFQQAAFLDCSFTECTFESCDLSGSKWHGCSFSDVVFSCCVMDHAQLHQNQWRQVMLDSCTLLEAALTSQDIMAARLFNVDLTEASLNRVEANGLELAGCLLDRTLFYRCLLDNVTTWALRIRSSGA
ncbi:MAG: pentapeptide repeat-containing protein, partial [Desulfovibrionaceae bacterium]